MSERINKKIVKKTPAQEFFEQVKMYNVGADWDAVHRVFLRKNLIENKLVNDLLTEIKEIKDDYGLLVRREIFLGVVPEEPDPEVELAEHHLKFSFLRELEHEGVIKNLREIKKEQTDEGSQWVENYAAITFYPSKLKNFLIKNSSGVIFSSDKPKIIFDSNLSILYVGEKSIKIKKLSEQYNLLNVIFNGEDQKQEWFFSEIGEIVDQYKKKNDKRFYNAAYQIRKKLEIFRVDDLFITTIQSIKINEKYLN